MMPRKDILEEVLLAGWFELVLQSIKEDVQKLLRILLFTCFCRSSIIVLYREN